MELFDTDRTFVNAELGKLYGIEVAGTGWVEARHPAGVPRAGLLTAAALLTPHDKAHQTSPTRRGAFIRNNYFCDHVPDPPPGVDTSPGLRRRGWSQPQAEPGPAQHRRRLQPLPRPDGSRWGWRSRTSTPWGCTA